MVALGGAPGAVASQAGLTGETAYSVSMSGATITWETDWEFVPRYNRVSENYDLIGLLSTTGFQMIGSLPTGTDPVAARDEFRVLFSEGATGIDNVEAGEYGTVAYALDLVDVRESVWAVFIVTSSATGYLMTYVTYAPADVLGTALDLARGSIEVDGLGILEGVDGAGVQAVVSAAAPNFEPDTVLE
jgi:hypothetical protein